MEFHIVTDENPDFNISEGNYSKFHYISNNLV